MKLKTIKTGYAVKVGDREGLHFSSHVEALRENFDIEAKYIEEIGECVVEIKNRRTGHVAWTTFSNVVYAEPDIDELSKPAAQSDVKAKRGRPFKVKSEEINP